MLCARCSRMKYAFVLLFLLVLCCGMVIPVKAEENGRAFEMESIALDEIPGNFMRTLHISDTESTDHNIRSVDVNAKGETVLCLTNNTVNIYSDTAEFLYSIRYNLEGASVAFWYDDEVAVYIVRSEKIVRLDENGIIDAYEVKKTAANNDIIQQIWNAKIISGDDHTCELSYSSDIQKIFLNPTKCILKKNGAEYIVYENKKATSNMIFEMCFYLFWLSLIAFVAVRSIRNYKRDGEMRQTESYPS